MIAASPETPLAHRLRDLLATFQTDSDYLLGKRFDALGCNGPCVELALECRFCFIELGPETSSRRCAIRCRIELRICESFLYADVIAGRESDIDQAIAVVGQLLGPAPA